MKFITDALSANQLAGEVFFRLKAGISATVFLVSGKSAVLEVVDVREAV